MTAVGERTRRSLGADCRVWSNKITIVGTERLSVLLISQELEADKEPQTWLDSVKEHSTTNNMNIRQTVGPDKNWSNRIRLAATVLSAQS